MARLIWTEPALADLEAVAEYVAIHNPAAASAFVRRVFAHVGQLAAFPDSGSRPAELDLDTRYRQIIEPPVRIFYRHDQGIVLVLHVMRAERLLRGDWFDPD